MGRLIDKILYYFHNPIIFKIVVLNHLGPYIKSDKLFIQLKWKLRMDYPLNINNPKTFSEKLQWLKLYDRKPEYTAMVDKYEAKRYVSTIIGKEYIIPTIAIFDKVEDIDFDMLPDQFVLKCTHDSGGAVICKNKADFDKKSARKLLTHFYNRRYFWQNREWPYKNVKPRIIAEKYMTGGCDGLNDYKFFCFNGEPEFCQVIANRETSMTIDFFDRNWVHQPFHEPKIYPFSRKKHKKPNRHEEMLDLSRKLSSGHIFLRVDFYEINGHVYFGELTFFPTSGYGGFDPIEWDFKFGEMLHLPEYKETDANVEIM